VLIDGGPSPARLLSHLGREMPFWKRDIDVLVLSDGRTEHVAGAAAALERYTVHHVLWAPVAQRGNTAELAHFRELLARQGRSAVSTVAGTQVALGPDLVMSVLSPEADDTDAGAVVRLEYGQTCFLYAASADRRAEEKMLVEGRLGECGVVHVARHGSDKASIQAWLYAVRPVVAAISVGRDQRGGVPAQETLDRLDALGVVVLRTDERGSIEWTSDGTQFEVVTVRR